MSELRSRVTSLFCLELGVRVAVRLLVGLALVGGDG